MSRASALLLLIPSWLGLLGGWHWLLDLFAHFRWQYLFASALVIAWACWQRRRGIAGLAVLTLLLNAFLIGRLAWHPQVGDGLAEDFKLRVLSLNVHTSNSNTQAVLDHVVQVDADMVFLMEVDEKWMAAMDALASRYPYRIAMPRSDNFGVALYSRIPWTREGILWLGEGRVPSIQASVTHQGREFVFIGTHPVPPISRQYSRWRDEQLRLLAQHASTLNRPVLLAGDLNATPWSAGIRPLTAGNPGLRFLDAPWRPTWRARSVLAIPIDHALASAPLVVTGTAVGPDVGSDHRPLEITAGWAR
jgi:endonuclease/exonuclease/phosphatase (EEP) superfamily protein YafD